LRTLAITQNITVDGAIEMLGDWFDPQGQPNVDNSDLLEEMHRQDSQADGLLMGRRTFEDFRGYWPQLSDDPGRNRTSARRFEVPSGVSAMFVRSDFCSLAQGFAETMTLTVSASFGVT
jgi:dihydrofolate reductase